MQSEYGPRGLVVISVSLDEIEEPADTEKMKSVVSAQLKKLKATTFVNLLLDEKMEVWQQRLRFKLVPCLYVFDRQGRWIQFTATPPTKDTEKELGYLPRELKKDDQNRYYEVEALVKQLVQK